MKRNIIWLFVILSIICAIPCTAIAAAQILKTSDFDIVKEYPFISKISIGNIFIAKVLNDVENFQKYADIVIYLNAVGIVYLLIHSIYLRHMLLTMSIDLDEDQITPSDYAILVKNLPTNIT